MTLPLLYRCHFSSHCSSAWRIQLYIEISAYAGHLPNIIGEQLSSIRLYSAVEPLTFSTANYHR